MGGELAVAIGLAGAVAVPHGLPLDRVRPATAATIWMSVLGLRAIAAVGSAVFMVVYLPQTGLYAAIAQWCWHEALPLLSSHLGFSAHPLLHAAMILPGVALALSLLWLAYGLLRGWLALRGPLRRALGEGPLGSTVIEDDAVIVGVAGFGRGRIVLSRAALCAMDGGELRASLAHELGHLRRWHRPLLLLGSILGALGRVVPGTRAAESGLRFSLERDADEYAVRRTRDPLALASAICKAALARRVAGATGLSGGSVTRRLDHLEGSVGRAGIAFERGMRAVAVALVVATLGLAATVPGWALAAPPSGHALGAAGSDCHRH